MAEKKDLEERMKKIEKGMQEHQKLVMMDCGHPNFAQANKTCYEQGKIGQPTFDRNREVNARMNSAKHKW